MSQTPTQFILSIDKIMEDDVEAPVLEIAKNFGIEGLRGVVLKSPVDTGRFRGNWNVGIGTMDLSISDNEEKIPVNVEGGERITQGSAEIDKIDDLEMIWITNNLPYASALENGHSKIQAPGGMVALTFAELQAMTL